jgi:hypothetical protein
MQGGREMKNHYTITEILEEIFCIVFLLLSVPLAYLFLIVKIAWRFAESWHEIMYEEKDLVGK